ncbi:MAG: DUF2062 domain-containing protein [Nanoarchaeota archaeon]|nr:DUF2062 domain-containing protein [Nanoarchaeota archaeon]
MQKKKKKKNFRQHLDHHIKEIKNSTDSPHIIAFSFAVGTFINMLQIPFLNLWIALTVIVIFKKINKYAVFAALVFWNYFTMAPINVISYKIGQGVFGNSPVVVYQLQYLTQFIHFTKRMVVGSMIMAIPVSIASYLGVRLLMVLYYQIKSYKLRKKSAAMKSK